MIIIATSTLTVAHSRTTVAVCVRKQTTATVIWTASDTAEIAADQLLLEALIKRMDKLAPGIFRAFELRRDGLSDTEIAQELDIPRTTLLSRMKKVTATLTEEFF